MKNQINRYIFSQTQFESASLTQLGFVVHQFHNDGLFLAEVSRYGKPAYTFQISISKKYTHQQISLDLEKLHPASKRSQQHKANKNCTCEAVDQTFELLKGGYGLFYVGAGAGGYSVRTSPADEKSKDVFNSTELGDGDLFGITLLRPGKYTFIKKGEKRKLSIDVEPVKHDKKTKSQYTPPEPVRLDSQAFGKSKEIKLLSAQGLVYKASGNDSISIALVKPYDNEDKDKSSKVAHRKKPYDGPAAKKTASKR